MKKIAFFLLFFFVFAFFGCQPTEIKKARQELELLYIDKNIYRAVSCDSEKINKEYYVFCRAAASKSNTGGLFLVKRDNSTDKYTIYTVNGKAAQHAGKYSRLEEYKDIPKILKHF